MTTTSSSTASSSSSGGTGGAPTTSSSSSGGTGGASTTTSSSSGGGTGGAPTTASSSTASSSSSSGGCSCPPPDACHEAGTCDPVTLLCSYATKADGAACDDGTGCSLAGTCQAGVCTSVAPGTVVWSTDVKSPEVFTQYPDGIVAWQLSPLAVGASGRALFGITYDVPSEIPGSPWGYGLFGLEGDGTPFTSAHHPVHENCGQSQGLSKNVIPKTFGAQHYAFDNWFGTSGCDGTSFVDSDSGSFTGPYSSPFSIPTRRTISAGNAAGDLLVAGANGTDLLRIDDSKATIYTKPLPSVTGLAAGAAGDAYVTGNLVLGADLGCGPISGVGDFAARISPSGACVWSRAVPSGAQILVGGARDLVFGRFQGTVDLGCGAMTSGTGSATYVAALDAAGACVWSKSVQGANVSLLPSGDPLLSGTFTGSVDVGCGPVSSGAGSAFLVARLDATGACVWSRSLTATSPTIATIGPNDIVYATQANAAVDLGGGPLAAVGVQDLALARLDGSTGATVWSKRIGGAGATLNGRLEAEKSGGVYVRGNVSGTVDPGGGPLTDVSYLLHLNGAGGLRFQRPLAASTTGSDACGAAIIATITDACIGCGYIKSATIKVERIAP
ncbi:Hypothetical protein A7982_03094 [Minicystis rosea]|nr:Hypothetical protein A7982_03094 [Minicystis rosea]